MADSDGVWIYVGTYASEADAPLDPEEVKVLRESGEVGYYDVSAVTDFALHTAAATVADLSTKHRQRELATRFRSEVAAAAVWRPAVPSTAGGC